MYIFNSTLQMKLIGWRAVYLFKAFDLHFHGASEDIFLCIYFHSTGYLHFVS